MSTKAPTDSPHISVRGAGRALPRTVRSTWEFCPFLARAAAWDVASTNAPVCPAIYITDPGVYGLHFFPAAALAIDHDPLPFPQLQELLWDGVESGSVRVQHDFSLPLLRFAARKVASLFGHYPPRWYREAQHVKCTMNAIMIISSGMITISTNNMKVHTSLVMTASRYDGRWTI